MKRTVICLLLAAFLLFAGCKPAPKPVLTCEAADYIMTAEQLSYYFCYQYAGILDAYGDQAFDPKQSLSLQSYDENQSWEEFFVSQALTLAEQTMQLCLAAEAEGFTLPQTGDLDAITADTAREQGYVTQSGEGDVAAYLKANYGEGATLEGYRDFLESMALASAYSEHLHTSSEFSNDEIEAFYDSREADYADSFGIAKTDARPMDIRLIRFYPDDPGSADHWADAEARAQSVLEEFEKDPTEANFAALADARTEDFNAPEGGLYTGVSPGTQQENVDLWLYPADGTRAAGDYVLLEEPDACVLCYVSAVSERPYWMSVVENDMRYEAYFNAFAELQQKYVFEQYPENVDLRVPTAHSAANVPAEGVEAVG
ncbi:MAG: hypothetical protein E7464_05835 [Ruminococcaceae bacterium]|nr:hypothetical protein [Oscillospiraceae bacterium]